MEAFLISFIISCVITFFIIRFSEKKKNSLFTKDNTNQNIVNNHLNKIKRELNEGLHSCIEYNMGQTKYISDSVIEKIVKELQSRNYDVVVTKSDNTYTYLKIN